jgi:Flp pilus assembly CpaF family ATPase
MGTVASYETDCPQPGAVLVKGGPTYVTGQKHITPERMKQLITEVAAQYGVEVDHDAPYCNQSIDTGHDGHEYLPTLAWQRDEELYKG